MSSGEVLRLLGTMRVLKTTCRPSEFLEIEDSYTAFCFDEACALIIQKLESGETPIIKHENSGKVYNRPSDIYAKFNKEV